MESVETGLYIHIPFCRAKCRYCDFNSHAGREDNIPAYFDALETELLSYVDRLAGYRVKTIFIGGGTPSLLDPRYIYELMNHCRQSFDIISDAEVSMETNPGTLTYEKLISYKAVGINRLSIGLQAWQNRVLASLGRIHRVEEFVENYKLAQKVGFKNINVDLIFGLPGQTMKDWMETVKNVIALDPAHISCYSLKIEEDTDFGRQLEAGLLVPAEDELDREMYATAIYELTNQGFKHYEISNFARPGYECRHNLIYWKGGDYIGIGLGAHSYFKGKRYNNIPDLDVYESTLLSGGDITEEIQTIDETGLMAEFIILGLRLLDGISTNEFYQKFNRSIFEVYPGQLDNLYRRKLLENSGERLRLTYLGLDLANQVFMEFI